MLPQHGALRQADRRAHAAARRCPAPTSSWASPRPGVLKAEWLPLMADKPLILALANPEPEILPEAVRAARPDAIVATGRSDYPNQVNNVLCFPFIFRGALDVGATSINEEMKVACRRSHRRAGPRGSERGGGRGLWRRGPGVRPGIHHSQAVRPAPDPRDRPGRGAGRDEERRGDPPDRGLRRLPPRAGRCSSTAPAN